MTLKALLILGMVLAGSLARAELLAGTSTNAPDFVPVAVGDYGFGAGYPVLQARSITTGSAAYNLTSIFFGPRLSHFSGPGGLSVSVYNNAGNAPGTPVAGGQNLFSATSANVGQMLNAASTVALAANSTYWFVASADQSGGATKYFWELTSSAVVDSEVPGFGMPLVNAYNSGSGWMVDNTAGLQMQVYGTAVPEPATLSFFALGGMGSWLMRRRNQRRIRGNRGPEFEKIVYHVSFMDEERDTSPLGGII